MDVYGNGGESLSSSWFPAYGEIFDYFSNPSETVITLLQTLPHLSPELRNQVRTYLQNNYGPSKTYDVTRIAHIGYGTGVDRNPNSILQDMFYPHSPTGIGAPYRSPTNPQQHIICGGGLSCGYWNQNPPINSYAAWKYAQEFGNAAEMYGLVANRIDLPPSNLSDLIDRPYLLNLYAAGLYGHLQLADLAGQPRRSDVQNSYNTVKTALTINFSKDNPFIGNYKSKPLWHRMYMRTLSVSRNFMFLTPEIVQEVYRQSLVSQTQGALNEYNYVAPYWFVSAFDNSVGEGTSQHLYDNPALFQARAYILNTPYEDLVKYLDVPVFETGDLFYIQNLVAAIEAPSDGSPTPTPHPADRNADGVVNIFDLNMVINQINTLGYNTYLLIIELFGKII